MHKIENNVKFISFDKLNKRITRSQIYIQKYYRVYNAANAFLRLKGDRRSGIFQ